MKRGGTPDSNRPVKKQMLPSAGPMGVFPLIWLSCFLFQGRDRYKNPFTGTARDQAPPPATTRAARGHDGEFIS